MNRRRFFLSCVKKDCFFAEFFDLGVGNVPITDKNPESLIVYSVVVSGALFSWIMKLKVTITLALRILTGIRFVLNKKAERDFAN